MSAPYTLEDLVRMKPDEVKAVFLNGHPLEADEVADCQYLGVDLCLPAWVNKILWKTFRKTFYRDPKTGIIRGWNVRLKQTGWSGPTTPLTKSNGKEISFGHYQLLSAEGKKFPGSWKGSHYLDYGSAGNHPWDPAAYTYCPIVAVNPGSSDLLLGWEVFKIGPWFIPLSDYWALKKEGPLTTIVQPPQSK